MNRETKMKHYGVHLKNRFVVYSALLPVLIVGIIFLPEPVQRAAENVEATPVLNVGMSFLLAWAGFVMTVRMLQCACVKPRRALITYLWFALGMAGLYSLLYEYHDGCIRISNTDLPVTLFDFIYFSFVSVSTLGYGDMVPDHTLIRLLVISQIVFAGYLLFRVSVKNPSSKNGQLRRANQEVNHANRPNL